MVLWFPLVGLIVQTNTFYMFYSYPLLRLNLLPGIPPTFWFFGLPMLRILHLDQAYHLCKIYLPHILVATQAIVRSTKAIHVWYILPTFYHKNQPFMLVNDTIVPWIGLGYPSFWTRQSQVHARWTHLLPGFWAHGSCSCPHHGGLR